MNLIEDFTIKGKWWLPVEYPEDVEEFFGELSFKKYKGLQLTIEGSFFGNRSILNSKTGFTIPFIYGVGREGHHYSIVNSFGNELGSNNWVYTELQPDYVLVNHRGYMAIDQMGINTFNFTTNFFHSFFGESNQFVQSDFAKSYINFDFKNDKTVEVIDNEKINAYFFFAKGFSGLGGEEITLRQKIALNVKFKEGLIFSDALDKINYIRDFFTFLSFPVISFESINLFTRDDKDKMVEFVVLFKQQAKSIGEEIRPYEVLLNYEEIKDNLPKLFQSWLENEELNKSVSALYMQLAYLNFPSVSNYS
ncbi:ApeA N-terminal domain 1-containing protein [Ferruginibacter albus]|uniref:ApeA N-terminal domain 1-containing protein n=1 Tax=Ferruginibacter albus TaxID=2875540 RepID=UPI002106B929|nr:hypothetical protein [Ferruginibacter albus]UAY53218.1 hypothetical protein K9M53_05990 [Ferruginibacter albus]